MIRLAWSIVVWASFLAGCGNAPYPAPVREARISASGPERAERDTPARARAPRAEKRLPPPAPKGFYRVRGGDTLYKIAFDQGLDVNALAEWNALADPGRIQTGAVLRLTPPPGPVAVTRTVSQKPLAVTEAPVSPPVAPYRPHTSAAVWGWPTAGTVLLRFGEDLNKGIDIAGVRGQPIQAAAEGRVVYAGAGLRGYGKLIIIRHGKALLSAYAHQARILVREGQAVVRGQVIGEMGDTDADQVKLHFEIREHGKPVDPHNYLPPLT